MNFKAVFYIYIFSIFLFLNGHGQNSAISAPKISIYPYVSIYQFSPDLHLNRNTGYGISVLYSVNSNLKIGLDYQRVKTGQPIELIGNTDQLEIEIKFIQFNLQWLVFSPSRTTRISTTAGLGAAVISSSAYQVSLGALGQTEISGGKETNQLYSLGIVFSQYFGSRIALQVIPQTFFIYSSTYYTNFMITGGLSVGIR
jgi:hypothetical protein